jgi:hypothetical protein
MYRGDFEGNLAPNELKSDIDHHADYEGFTCFATSVCFGPNVAKITPTSSRAGTKS